MNWRVTLADLAYTSEEEQAVLEVVKNRWLTMGKETETFEREFVDCVGSKYAVAVSNGTVALHLACLSLGIGPGDEVVVPALSFVASSNSVLHTGAKVRFVDIQSLNELNISPAKIEAAITPETKAIMVMHYGGYPCRMDAILEIAERHNLAVIEDAAHAHGAALHGKNLGCWGDVGCFSFFSNKNLATGEGGMLVTDREDIAEKVRLLRSHGMTSLTWDRHKGRSYNYDVIDLGFNYRIDEIRSALGRVQLKKLGNHNRRRKEITEEYWEHLRHLGLGLPFENYAGESSHHIFPILLPDDVDRMGFIKKMHTEGIQTSIHYTPIHHFQYYRERYPEVNLPLTEEAASREVTLPLYPSMRDEDVRLVIDTVRATLTSMT